MAHKAMYQLAIALVVTGCGFNDNEAKGTRVEYYVEEGEFSQDAAGKKRPGADAGQGSEDGDGSGSGSGDVTGSGSGSDTGTGSGDGSGSETALALTFVSPSAADSGGGTVSVIVEFAGSQEGDTWSLYFAETADSATGTAIAEDLPVSTTAVDWDTSGLTPGTWWLYAVLTRDGQTVRSPASASVAVAAPGTNSKPTVKITLPVGEEVFVAGTARNITWEASDADSDALTYKVEYSPDGGTTWTMLAENLTAPTYAWDVTGLNQGITYRVRVTADDGKSGASTSVSPKSFGVAPEAPTFAVAFGAMLATRCGTCHEAGGRNAAQFRSDSFDLANIGVEDKTMNILNRIGNNTMPPAGFGALLQRDREILTMWNWTGNQ